MALNRASFPVLRPRNNYPIDPNLFTRQQDLINKAIRDIPINTEINGIDLHFYLPDGGGDLVFVDENGDTIFTITPDGLSHDELINLTTSDDHTQYLLLAGRSGGQVAIGGTAASETLTLQSTSDATKGKIILGVAGTSVYDEVNDRLGLGTASPSVKLHLASTGFVGIHVAGDTDGDAGEVGSGYIRLSQDANAVALLMGPVNIAGNDPEGNALTNTLANATVFENTYSAGAMQFATNGAVRATIDTSGRLGLGTTSPQWAVHILGSGYPSLLIESTDTSGGDLQLKSSAGQYQLYMESADLKFWDGTTDRVTFANGGNVGIGVGTPLAKLHVQTASAGTISPYVGADELVVEGSGSSGISIYSGNAAFGSLVFADADSDLQGGLFYNHVSDSMQFYVNGANRVYIDSAGDLGIATSEPIARLEIEDGGTANTILFKITADDANPYALAIGNDTYSATDTNALLMWLENTGVAYIDSPTHLALNAFNSQNVGINTASPNAKLTIVPGAVSTTTIGSTNIYLGARLQTTSGRSGYVAETGNDLLNGLANQAHFLSLFPFADSANSDDRTWKSFRASHGSTLADSFWVDKYGRGYFAGEVGIGTTSPSYPLHVVNNGTQAISIRADGNITGQANQQALYATADGANTNNYVLYGSVSGGTTDWGLYITGEDKSYLSGNLGIGTASPSSKLEVAGDITIGATETFYSNRMNWAPSLGSIWTTISCAANFTRLAAAGSALVFHLPLTLPKSGTISQVDLSVAQSAGNTTSLALYRQDFAASTATLVSSTTFNHTTQATVSLTSLAHSMDADSVYFLRLTTAAATYNIDCYGTSVSVQNPIISAIR